jgi:hypothetical protein
VKALKDANDGAEDHPNSFTSVVAAKHDEPETDSAAIAAAVRAAAREPRSPAAERLSLLELEVRQRRDPLAWLSGEGATCPAEDVTHDPRCVDTPEHPKNRSAVSATSSGRSSGRKCPPPVTSSTRRSTA